MRKIILMIMLPLFLVSCVGRVPSNKSAANIAKGYFKKYGHKFKETEFGNNPVNSVEVKEVQELQKNVATSFLVVKLNDGTELPVIMTFLRKLPLGWRTTGWEKVTQ
jgi:hypothetical protein